MRRSAIIERLERYTSLTPAERDALDWAERRDHRLPAGAAVLRQGEPAGSLFIVQHGWLHSSIRLADGARQILRFHYAGDLIGTSSIAWSTASETLTAIDDCIVSELPKPNLGRLFREQPRLAGVLYAITAAEAVAMSDRLTSVGRMDAADRLTFLLLDMLARLKVSAGGIVDAFDLPLTQTDLGDALGLTKVHVNRCLRALEDRGVIERNGRRIRILNAAEEAKRLGFVDRYAVIETGWLAPAHA